MSFLSSNSIRLNLRGVEKLNKIWSSVSKSGLVDLGDGTCFSFYCSFGMGKGEL